MKKQQKQHSKPLGNATNKDENKQQNNKNFENNFENNLEKDFTSVSTAYPDNLKPVKKASEALFRKEKCHQSKVQCKNQNLKK